MTMNMENPLNKPCTLSSSSDLNATEVVQELSKGLDSKEKDDISQLEEKIAAISLSVQSTQRSLKNIYRHKTDLVTRNNSVEFQKRLTKQSLLRRTRSLLDFGRRKPDSLQTPTSHVQIGVDCPKSPTALDNAITYAEDTLQHLIKERHRLTLDLVNWKLEITSRRDKLPVEIWAKIFLLCLPDERFITPRPLDAPMLLCQVCSLWRKIAITTPFLWNKLAIRFLWQKRIRKTFLEIWLNRSSNACLCLDIFIAADRDISGVDHHIFRSIAPTSYRWQHLRLNLPNAMLRSVLKSDMPQLRMLEIYSSEYMTLHIHPAQVPQLRRVSFLSMAVYLHAHILPWKQLTHLDSRCWLNVSQHADIISSCPNLLSYSMCLIHMVTEPLGVCETKEIFHPRLKILRMKIFRNPFIDPAMDFRPFQLPKLSELTLIVSKDSPFYASQAVGWPKADILALIQRSLCSLTKLHFRGFFMTFDDIDDVRASIHLPKVIHANDNDSPLSTIFLV